MQDNTLQVGEDTEDPVRTPTRTPPTHPEGTPHRPNRFHNVTIHNDRQNDIADVLKYLCLYNLPPETFRRKIAESMQIGDVADPSVQNNPYFIGRIRQTLDDIGIDTQYLEAYENEFLGHRVI